MVEVIQVLFLIAMMAWLGFFIYKIGYHNGRMRQIAELTKKIREMCDRKEKANGQNRSSEVSKGSTV